MAFRDQPILSEHGVDDRTLLIGATGLAHSMGMPMFEFFELSKIMKYSYILLRDRYYLWYHQGIDEKRNDYPSLVSYLRGEIEDMSPEIVLCAGVSSGGYAAIVLGHQLGADYVHAFGPQTYLLLPNLIGEDKYQRLCESDNASPEYFDLAELLANSNGRTRYYIHYCVADDNDRNWALYLEGLPGVTCLGYPCGAHNICVFLGKRLLLQPILERKHQADLPNFLSERIPELVIDDSEQPVPT